MGLLLHTHTLFLFPLFIFTPVHPSRDVEKPSFISPLVLWVHDVTTTYIRTTKATSRTHCRRKAKLECSGGAHLVIDCDPRVCQHPACVIGPQALPSMCIRVSPLRLHDWQSPILFRYLTRCRLPSTETLLVPLIVLCAGVCTGKATHGSYNEFIHPDGCM
ncbi:hypothetical protein EDB85DRAFT_287797 [Lactarius pseudohatsudake]|nr:hypothetical protein EDB85DRAFT_287797 [Lactarius pseudohatsudake]